MAHNLAKDQKTGEYSFFCVGDRKAAWHYLGQRIDEAPTWETACKLAHLDYRVNKHQFSSPYTGEPVNAWGTFREDTGELLGAVGSSYQVIQNEDMFKFIDGILQTDQARIETAGALGVGEKVWALARIPRDIIVVNPEDVSNCYLLFTTSHDGSSAAVAKLSTVRVVCQNTLNMALEGKQAAFDFRHTARAEDKIKAASETIFAVNMTATSLETWLNELANRRINSDSFTAVIKSMFPFEDDKVSTRTMSNIEKITDLFESNDKDAFPNIRGTGYNLFNAFVEYADYYKGVRVTDPSSNEEHTRAVAALFGSGELFKAQSLISIIELTKDAPRYDPRRTFVATGV